MGALLRRDGGECTRGTDTDDSGPKAGQRGGPLVRYLGYANRRALAAVLLGFRAASQKAEEQTAATKQSGPRRWSTSLVSLA